MADKVEVGLGQHLIRSSASAVKSLAASLDEPATFQNFAHDPKAHAKAHGVQIDDALGEKLKKALAGKNSLAELQDEMIGGGDGPSATIAAVVQGAFVISSTKIALVV